MTHPEHRIIAVRSAPGARRCTNNQTLTCLPQIKEGVVCSSTLSHTKMADINRRSVKMTEQSVKPPINNSPSLPSVSAMIDRRAGNLKRWKEPNMDDTMAIRVSYKPSQMMFSIKVNIAEKNQLHNTCYNRSMHEV